MGFCPKCRYEYEEDVTSCPDCQEQLVDTLSDENGEIRSVGRFVPLPNLPGRVYAEMVKGALDEQGIPSYIRAKGVGDVIQSPGTMPMDGVRLYVPEDRLDECRQIQHQMLDHI